MSNIRYQPLSLCYSMWSEEWRDMHTALNLLPADSRAASLISRALNEIEERSRERFGMVVWSFDDLCGTVASLRNRMHFEYGDFATLDQAGITRHQAEEIAMIVNVAIQDAMTPHGWQALEYRVQRWLEEHGVEPERDDLE